MLEKSTYSVSVSAEEVTALIPTPKFGNGFGFRYRYRISVGHYVHGPLLWTEGYSGHTAYRGLGLAILPHTGI